MSKRMFVSNKDETIRLFENPVLEYFSHIHPATPLIVFLPACAIMYYFGLQELSFFSTLLAFFGGILFWTLFEYVFHRFAFHYHPKSETGKKIHFLVHGIHHDYPRDSTRLVMPLLVSLPLAVMFYFLFQWIFGVYHFNIFAGFIFGYVAYDSIHYATHHMKMKNGIGKFLKEYHLRHHYNDDNTAYGVSNPLWDYIFRTVPPHVKEDKDSK
ncbi:MAG TPA: fatty acid hydroxylase [Bacteroidetes bacterium]|nr:fatty acid hydroxylase [Bacteroidota bacterium]HCN36688.1 fatty acid hydroxylase [Bacteroidota bacterium]